jgi:hypothetical protein
MKTTDQIRLIDGTFQADDAKDILLNLFNYKINFHELKNFSSWERNGINHDHSSKRLPELKADRDKIAAMINEIIESGDEVVILSTISIQRVKSKHVQEPASADSHKA